MILKYKIHTWPPLRRMSSLAFASSASCFALTARFAAIFSRSSASRCFFSSSVKGLIYSLFLQ